MTGLRTRKPTIATMGFERHSEDQPRDERGRWTDGGTSVGDKAGWGAALNSDHLEAVDMVKVWESHKEGGASKIASAMFLATGIVPLKGELARVVRDSKTAVGMMGYYRPGENKIGLSDKAWKDLEKGPTAKGWPEAVKVLLHEGAHAVAASSGESIGYSTPLGKRLEEGAIEAFAQVSYRMAGEVTWAVPRINYDDEKMWQSFPEADQGPGKTGDWVEGRYVKDVLSRVIHSIPEAERTPERAREALKAFVSVGLTKRSEYVKPDSYRAVEKLTGGSGTKKWLEWMSK